MKGIWRHATTSCKWRAIAAHACRCGAEARHVAAWHGNMYASVSVEYARENDMLTWNEYFHACVLIFFAYARGMMEVSAQVARVSVYVWIWKMTCVFSRKWLRENGRNDITCRCGLIILSCEGAHIWYARRAWHVKRRMIYRARRWYMRWMNACWMISHCMWVLFWSLLCVLWLFHFSEGQYREFLAKKVRKCAIWYMGWNFTKTFITQKILIAQRVTLDLHVSSDRTQLLK